MTRHRAILANRLYVPRHAVNEWHRDAFRHNVFLHDHRPEGPGDTAEVLVENFRDFETHVGFCRGDLKKIKKIFRKFRIKDKRAWVPHEIVPQFTGLNGGGYKELFPEQRSALVTWLDESYGLLEAPPRWGKNVWFAALVCTLRQRTLLLAHTIDLVEQALEEFYTWTNIRELERYYKTKLAGRLDTWGDYYPILTGSTWQKFHLGKGGRRQIKRRRDDFGLVWVDEAHKVNAPCYTVVANGFNPYFRGGMTATPYMSRSQLHVICNDILGPVTSVGIQQQLPLVITMVRTPYQLLDGNVQNWTQMLTNLAKSEERNRFIARCVYHDLRSRHVCMITTDRVKHGYVLRDMLLEHDEGLVIEVINNSTSKEARKEIRNRAKRGGVDVIIGMNSIIQLGFNVPPLSALHNTMPLTNPENWYQRYSRVRTKMRKKDIVAVKKGSPYCKKRPPVARVYYDPGYSRPTMSYVNTVKKDAEKRGFLVREWNPTSM